MKRTDTPENDEQAVADHLPTFIRPARMAQLLGVSEMTISRWERAGKFPRRKRLGPNVVGWPADDYRALMHNLPDAATPRAA
jgi:prophage regulatory protein